MRMLQHHGQLHGKTCLPPKTDNLILIVPPFRPLYYKTFIYVLLNSSPFNSTINTPTGDYFEW